MSDTRQVYTQEASGREFTVKAIVFRGGFEAFDSLTAAYDAAKELAESHDAKFTVVNVLVEPNGDLLAIQYEAVVNVTTVQPERIGQ